MADVDIAGDIEAPAAQVWKIIGDFGAVRRWASVVQEERVEETPEGPVRTLVMAEGRTVRERKIIASELSYTYTILDSPALAEYRSTIAVVPLTPTLSRIVLVVHVVPGIGPDAKSDDELDAYYTRFVQANLKAMLRALREGAAA